MQLIGDQTDEFLAIMLKLRAECDWKAAQTHRSLSRYLLEETYETLEAIDSGEPDHLREELGDLLLQVYFHAVIAAESGEFTLDDVVAGITDKMIRRNPHVFGEGAGGGVRPDAWAINEAWEAIKATEKQRNSVLEGIPGQLPALLYADKALDRLQRAGNVAPPTDANSDDLGERLLALVAEAQASGIDAEQSLRDAVRRRVDGAT